MRTIDVDAQGMVLIDPESVGRGPFEPLLAIAEGAAQKPDSQGGIAIYDLSVNDSTVPLVASVMTAGFDFDVGFSDGVGSTVTTTGSGGGSFTGPYLLSVDGEGPTSGGGPGTRFGAWRMFQLGQTPQGGVEIEPVATRLINHSAMSFAAFNGLLPGVTDPAPFLSSVPNDRGVPIDLAVLNTANGPVSYVANVPFIGLQLLAPDGMNVDQLGGVQGTVVGSYRSVEVLRANILVAVRRDGAQDVIVLLDPSLGSSAILAEYPLSGEGGGGRVAGGLVAIRDWPTCVAREPGGDSSSLALPPWLIPPEAEGGGATADPQAIEDPECERREPRNLVLVLGQGGITVLPVDPVLGRFDPSLLDNGIGVIKTPGGSPRDAHADVGTQLLLVADGTAGLSVVDFSKPGGAIDEDRDGIDDRVLTTMPVASDSGGPPVANEVTAYVAPSCELRALVHGSAPVTEISLGEGIGLKFTEIKNLYTVDENRKVKYVPGYASEDDLGRVYTNHRFNETDPNNPEWAADDNYIELTVEATRTDMDLTGARVVWTIEDPDDPTDSLVHPDFRAVIDPNDYDQQGTPLGAVGEDNSYATVSDDRDDAYELLPDANIADILQRPGFSGVDGFPIQVTEAAGDNNISAETDIVEQGDGGFVSSVRLDVSDVGGDNYIARASLDIGGAGPCVEMARTGKISVWDLALIDHAVMSEAVAALPATLERAVREFEIAFVHLQVEGEPRQVGNLGSMSTEPGNVNFGQLINQWITNNFPHRMDAGWISFASVNRVTAPTVCPQILFPQPEVVISDGSRNPFHTWGLSESFISEHEEEEFQLVVEATPGSSVRVAVQDGSGVTLGEAIVAPDVSLITFSGELCGEVYVAADVDLVPAQYSLKLPAMRGLVDLVDEDQVQLNYPPPQTGYQPIQFDLESLPSPKGLSLRVWRSAGSDERVFFDVAENVSSDMARMAKKPSEPVFPPPAEVDRGISSYFPNSSQVMATMRRSSGAVLGLTVSQMPGDTEQSKPHIFVGHRDLSARGLSFDGTAVHELGHVHGVRHLCGNWGYDRAAACPLNFDGMFVLTDGTPDQWSPQDGRKLCAEHIRAIRSARYESETEGANLGWGAPPPSGP